MSTTTATAILPKRAAYAFHIAGSLVAYLDGKKTDGSGSCSRFFGIINGVDTDLLPEMGTYEAEPQSPEGH